MMMQHIWLASSLLVIAMFSNTLGAFVGINIGTGVSNLPSPSEIVAILKAHQLTHVRLYNADPHLLTALSNTGIEVTVGITNDEVLPIGKYPSEAAAWINKNVAAYLPATNITAVAVGNEVLSSVPHVGLALFPAMNNLHKALVASNLDHRIKVSTPQSMAIVPDPFPPSTAAFDSKLNSTIFPILQFLKNTNSYYMLNAYPYSGYVSGDGIFPIDYALFRPLTSVKGIVDPNTLFHYDNMFDAMVDATYNSIANLNFSGVGIVVTETGWPWRGGDDEPAATVENAEIFNNNLIRRVLNGSGPPGRPEMPVSAYIYELLNEDKRAGPVSARNWGAFFANGTAIYRLDFDGSGRAAGNSSSIFCVAKRGADPGGLGNGLNWACGQGQANCSEIQPGRACYFPDSIENHASYAYNDYYQKMHSVGGTCDFHGTATTTTVDPSYGSCIFTGSLNSSRRRNIPSSMALGPISATNDNLKLQVSKIWSLVFAAVFAL